MTRVVVAEEHASVLRVWKARGVRGATAIVLDAHLDLAPMPAERIEELRACATSEALAAFEKPWPFEPDGAYSYGIESFLYPAHRLGLVQRLIWVSGRSRQDHDAWLRSLRLLPGVSPAELAGFRRSGDLLEGRLLGLELVLCDVGALAGLALPAECPIDIDIDYFLAAGGAGAWTDPRQVFETLAALALDPPSITVSRSVESGFTPLRHRFWADYLAALWRRDQALSGHYARLFEHDRRALAGDLEAARRGCREELRRHPGCAATHHLLGLCDPEAGAGHLAEAARLDPAYRSSVLRDACALLNRRAAVDPAAVRELERRLAACGRVERPRAHAVLGLLHARLQDPEGVFRHHRAARRLAGRHPRVTFQLGLLLYQAGRHRRAAPLLRAAAAWAETRAMAHLLLGDLHARHKEYELAARHLRTACHHLTAWAKPARMLAQIYRQLGDRRRCLAALEISRRIEAALDRGQREKIGA